MYDRKAIRRRRAVLAVFVALSIAILTAFFGWAGDTVDAKDQNEELKKEVQELRSELAEAQTAVRDSGQLKGIAELHELDYFPQGTQPVTARVIARSPTVWHSSVKIDKGTSDGVRVDQPVIAAGGGAGEGPSTAHRMPG